MFQGSGLNGFKPPRGHSHKRMVFLSEPDEKRLWLLIGALTALAILLLLASWQVPWYTATWSTGGTEFEGEFTFEEARVEVYANGQLTDEIGRDYSDDSPFGTLMSRIQIWIGLGALGAISLATLLYLHYSGRYTAPRLIVLSWLVGVGGIAGGITHFTLAAGSAGADEIPRVIASFSPQQAALFGTPDPLFWGTQDYGNGELVSAPGVGWLLAGLALLNLAAATLLLYQFPEGAAVEEDDESKALESFKVVAEESPESREHEAPISAHES